MRSSRITLAALAALSIFLISPADARQGSSLKVPTVDVAAIPAYPFPGQIRAPRGSSRAASHSRKDVRTARHSPKDREAYGRSSVAEPMGDLESNKSEPSRVAVGPGKVCSRKTGVCVHVAASHSADFQAYIDDLEQNHGATIYYMGGYRPGPCANYSLHPCGLALDVCQDYRGHVSGHKNCHLPGPHELATIAAAHGLFEGGQWCHSDYGHAQVGVTAAKCGGNLYSAVGKYKAARSAGRRRHIHYASLHHS